MPIKIKGGVPELLLDDALRAVSISDTPASGQTDEDVDLTFGDIDARVNYETIEKLRQEREKEKKERREKKIEARKKKGKKRRFNRPSTQRPRPRSKPSHAR